MQIPPVSDRYSPVEVQEYYDAGCWSTETLPALVARQATAFGAKTFITDGTVSYTYAQLRDQSIRLATGLAARGVTAGDRVAVQLPNWAEFVLVAAAVARLGAIMVPVMPIYRRDEVGHVLDDAEVSAVVTPAVFKGFDFLGMYRDLASTRPEVHTIVVVRDDAAAEEADTAAAGVVTTLAAVTPEVEVEQADADLGTPVTADAPYVIVYTSGTTARPKGCVHTFNTYSAGARALTEAFAFTVDDVAFSPSPITHTTGLVTGVLLPLLTGGATHVMAEWEPVRGLAEIARYGCSVSVTATTFIQMLLDAYDPDQHDASSIRVWVSAGAPIPRGVVERARKLLPDAKILSLYGRSENLATTTCTVDDDPEKALISDGAAMPFGHVQVVDDQGRSVRAGEEGDIAYRGPSHMLGYLNRPQETAELYTPEGYSRSGDLGVMDADGYVRVTGRTKDIVIRGGMNISVREIEDLLTEHPGVRGVAVVGMPDERLGERVCCYVLPTDAADPPTLDVLKAFLKERGVAVQKTPERLELIAEMPTTATGKIQKHLLRQDIVGKLEQEATGSATGSTGTAAPAAAEGGVDEAGPDGQVVVYPFDHDHGVPARTLVDLLGGKGAGLAEMTALGLPVPPGFTIPVDTCRRYLADGWPDGLDELVAAQVEALGAALGRRFGDPADPLLLAVRSGAPRSMPGMLDTVLDLGLDDATCEGLATASGDPAFAWDCYRRFVRMYATTVLGSPPDALGEQAPSDDVAALRAEIAHVRKAVHAATDREFPDDPHAALRGAIEAVFRSCGSARAQAYRRHEELSDELATAVNVQAMVFGNRGADSGTGVVFTRDPATGEARRYGDYLPRAQGEDVVSGAAATQTIDALAVQQPRVWAELDEILDRLERHYADICDVEFTVEQGRLWILQTRVGKRSAVAAVRSAVQMAEDEQIPLTHAQAVERVGAEVRAAARHAVLRAASARRRVGAITRGVGASPGRVTGRAVFSSAEATGADGDDDIVLIRPETSPEDVPGMSVSVGVITGRGGLVSHAAVVARGWGLPAVVGAEELVIDESGAVTVDGTHTIAPGELVTLDGTTGEIWVGPDGSDGSDGADANGAEPVDEAAVLREQLPELLVLESWSGETS